jgi:hypothetical protein
MESDDEDEHTSSHDPTGGRGLSSNMDAKLKAASDQSVLDSAV